METQSWYTKTVLDRKSGLEAVFITIPRTALLDTALLDPNKVQRASEILSELGLQKQSTVVGGHPNALIDIMRGCLFASSISNSPASESIELLLAKSTLKESESLNEFASHLVSAPLVPIENSPLELHSLASIFSSLKSAGTNSVGAWMGLVAAGGHPLLVFVTVPFGIIIVGAAVGVAKALEEGLRERVGRLIGGRKRPRLPKRRIRINKD